MRTTLDLPQKLLEEARKTSGAPSKTQAIIIALEEMIQRKKSRSVLKLKGTLRRPFDYKTLRRKR